MNSQRKICSSLYKDCCIRFVDIVNKNFLYFIWPIATKCRLSGIDGQSPVAATFSRGLSSANCVTIFFRKFTKSTKVV